MITFQKRRLTIKDAITLLSFTVFHIGPVFGIGIHGLQAIGISLLVKKLSEGSILGVNIDVLGAELQQLGFVGKIDGLEIGSHGCLCCKKIGEKIEKLIVKKRREGFVFDFLMQTK